jgi:hypothetical protein
MRFSFHAGRFCSLFFTLFADYKVIGLRKDNIAEADINQIFRLQKDEFFYKLNVS